MCRRRGEAHLGREEEVTSLKIAEIEVITLFYRYLHGGGFLGGKGACTGRLSSLVRVYTDNGIVGTGSVYSHPDLVRTIVEDHLRDMLVGQDPLDVEALWERNYDLTRWYGRKGVALSALGGLDIALWDIRGKVVGKPLYSLLGGQRDRVPAYASALLWKEDQAELGREAHRHLWRGFRAMKMRLGRNHDYDCAALRIVRDAIGPQARLMIEANARYSLAEAERMIPEFRASGVFWLEEPFAPEDLESYLALRPRSGVPLAAGENEFGVQGFQELIERRAVDIVQPDCCRGGGITECRRIGLLAAKHGLRVATHTWSDAIALVANMHLIASLPNGIAVEIDCTGNGLIDSLLTEPLRLSEGQVAMPQGPGLGIELNEEAIQSFTLPKGTKIPDGNYSDLIFGRGFYLPVESYELTGKDAG